MSHAQPPTSDSSNGDSPEPAEIGALDVSGGRIAYDVMGEGPLIVLSHGIGDMRQSYRFLAPRLASAGYRVVSADMRGHGQSSVDWASITRSDVAGDLIQLIDHLGGPAVIVGQSLSGGAATIAAARAPGLVRAVIELNPFTRVPKTDLGAMIRVGNYRRSGFLMARTMMFRSVHAWMRYLDLAYPTKPADWNEYTKALRAKLGEPGRMREFLKTMKSSGADAEAALSGVHAPALIIMGSADADFPNAEAEGRAIVASLPAGVGKLELIGGAGHYIHAERPDEVAALITDFLAQLDP